MNVAEGGIPLFKSVGPEDIGSVNLVLACLADGLHETEPTVRALLMRSGISGGAVNARACLCLAIQLGILKQDGQEVRLTALGEELLLSASWPPYKVLTQVQGRRLLDEMLQRSDFATPLARLMRKMRRRRDGSLEIIPGSISLPIDETQCLHALQSLSAVRYSNGVLLMDSDSYETIASVIGTDAAVTEDELLRLLELQRVRAVMAEEHVKEFEVDRLTKGGRQDIASLVERVAARDVAAGYDIRSFELDGSDRYIEVKSSTGMKIRFFLSWNERHFLEQHNSTAWIYFVPRVQDLPYLSSPVVAMPNPLQWINDCATLEEREFLVQFPDDITGSAASHDPGIFWLPRRYGKGE